MASKTSPENLPVLPPPPGVDSNFNDPESCAAVLIAFAVILPILSIVAVSGRVYCRKNFNPPLGADDVFSIAAVIFSIGFSASLIGGVPYGLGKHIWDVRLIDYEPRFTQYFMAGAMISSYQTLCFKLALLFLYKRLFGVSRRIYWITIVAGVIMGIVYIGSTLVGIFQCKPVDKLWYPELPGVCINVVPLVFSLSAFNIVTDVFLLILPIQQVWQLQNLERQMKIGATLIFVAGGGACIVSGIRTWRTVYTYESSVDFTWNDAGWCVASLWEYHIGTICGCIPVLKPLLHQCFPKLFPEPYFGRVRAQKEVQDKPGWVVREQWVVRDTETGRSNS